MDWIAFTGGAAIGAAAVFAWVVAVGIRARKARAAPKAEATPTPPDEKPQRWFPTLCGTRLELGATGYWIELTGKPGEPAYRGYDPEGECVISGADLPGMKERIERHAAYRDEFAPQRFVIQGAVGSIQWQANIKRDQSGGA